jgi:hypothetical protein
VKGNRDVKPNAKPDGKGRKTHQEAIGLTCDQGVKLAMDKSSEELNTLDNIDVLMSNDPETEEPITDEIYTFAEALSMKAEEVTSR